LHTWHYLSWFLFGFYPCEILELVVFSMASSSSSKTDFVWNSYCVFWCLENLPVPRIEMLITSKFIVNSPLLVLIISNKIGFISFEVSLQKLFGFWAVHFGPWSGQAGLQAGPSSGGPDRSGGPAELVFWQPFRPSAGSARRAAEHPAKRPVPPDFPPDRPAQRPAPPDLRPNWPAGCFQRPYFFPPINTLLPP
jgi:hypothetical protein